MRYYILLIALLGCSTDVVEEVSTIQNNDAYLGRDQDTNSGVEETHKHSLQIWVRWQFQDNCKSDTFTADNIPSGYIIDPECPPNIIWPPKFILPTDPSPVIR